MSRKKNVYAPSRLEHGALGRHSCRFVSMRTEKLSNCQRQRTSNTPMGPFQITVLAPFRVSFSRSIDLGPMSRPCNAQMRGEQGWEVLRTT